MADRWDRDRNSIVDRERDYDRDRERSWGDRDRDRGDRGWGDRERTAGSYPERGSEWDRNREYDRGDWNRDRDRGWSMSGGRGYDRDRGWSGNWSGRGSDYDRWNDTTDRGRDWDRDRDRGAMSRYYETCDYDRNRYESSGYDRGRWNDDRGRDWSDRDREHDRGWFDRAVDAVKGAFTGNEEDRDYDRNREYDRNRDYDRNRSAWSADRGYGASGGMFTGTRSAGYGAAGGFGSAMQTGSYAGRGPKNYQRSDDRITEEVAERLTRDPYVDASDVIVRVEKGVVTLTGTVHDRQQRRRTEDVISDIWGVKDVNNQLRVDQQSGNTGVTSGSYGTAGTATGTGTTGTTGSTGTTTNTGSTTTTGSNAPNR